MSENDYKGNTSLHEGMHGALAVFYELPFKRLTIIPGRGSDGRSFDGCLIWDQEKPESQWYINERQNSFTYPKDEAAGLGARTVLMPLTEEQKRQSIRHCIVLFGGAVGEEMDYFGPGKHTEWGPTYDFIDIRMRLQQIAWLDKTKAWEEEQFQELFDFTRLLFRDKQGDPTILWLRAIAIGKMLWRFKKLSEGEVTKIYYDVKDVKDRRYPDPEPWPKLRYLVDDEDQKKYHKGL